MKNRYPGTCATCKAQVLPGQGTLSRDKGRWTVTHDDPCPRDSLREENARNLTQRTMMVLDNMESDAKQLGSAVHTLGQLAATGWLDAETWRTRVMSSYAARSIDRLDLEDMLDTYLPVCA